jgi:hypothetical protein
MSDRTPKPGVHPLDRPFAWSYSRLKNFETCPKRHLHLDILKDIVEEESDAIQWGNYLHDRMAKAIGTDDNAKRNNRDKITEEPLPDTLAQYQPWVDRFRAPRESGAKVYVERGLAITADFKPTMWFGLDVWFRCKVDVEVVSHDQRFAQASDWKTGKRLDDAPQLALTAITLMVHQPTLEAVRTEYVWLKEFTETNPFRCAERKMFTRQQIPEMWSNLAPRVKVLEMAFKTKTFLPKPGPFCRRWCPVHTCEHHGK